MALAGTKPTGTSVSAPAGNSVLVGGVTTPSGPLGEVPSSPESSFSEVLKAIGWQGYLLIAVVTALYLPILIRLAIQWWNDADYSHGLLVPFVSLYLIWRKRSELAKIPRRPSFWGLAVVLASLAVLVLGSLGAELSLARVSIIGVICGLVLYFQGWTMLKELSFPIAFLLFCIPLPHLLYNEIVFPLQFIASGFATRVLEILNVFPIMREGNVLVMPGMRLEVVEACSGIRSLISLLALAAGYGYLAEKSNVVRWFMFLAMIPLAIVSNGTRVMITALMAHYIGPQAAEGFMHEFSGWVIFVVATILFLALHSLTVVIRKKLGWIPPDPPAKSPKEAVA